MNDDNIIKANEDDMNMINKARAMLFDDLLFTLNSLIIALPPCFLLLDYTVILPKSQESVNSINKKAAPTLRGSKKSKNIILTVIHLESFLVTDIVKHTDYRLKAGRIAVFLSAGVLRALQMR